MVAYHYTSGAQQPVSMTSLSFGVQIAVVSQEPVLFARSVKENIKYGQEDATDEEIFRAAEMANAHKFISDLPNGYSTGQSE